MHLCGLVIYLLPEDVLTLLLQERCSIDHYIRVEKQFIDQTLEITRDWAREILPCCKHRDFGMY